MKIISNNNINFELVWKIYSKKCNIDLLRAVEILNKHGYQKWIKACEFSDSSSDYWINQLSKNQLKNLFIDLLKL